MIAVWNNLQFSYVMSKLKLFCLDKKALISLECRMNYVVAMFENLVISLNKI